MSDEVLFGDENSENLTGRNSVVPGTPTGMLAWLIKNKVVKDSKQASYFLLGATILLVILAVAAFVSANSTRPIVKNFSTTDIIPVSPNSP